MKMRSKILMTCVMLTLCNLYIVTISGKKVNNAENADKNSRTLVFPVSNKNDLQPKLPGNQLQENNGDHKICADLELLRNDSTCNETLKQNKGTLENYSSATERRCILVNDILNDVCHVSTIVPQNYIKSNVSLCSRSAKMKSKENAPESVKKFVKLWEEDNANCILTCYNNLKFESDALCSFMVEYYTNTEKPNISSPKKEVENESKTDIRIDHKTSKDANQSFQPERNVPKGKVDEKVADALGETNDKNDVRNELKSSIPKSDNEMSEKKPVPHRLSETVLNEDSHAFSYFFFMSGVCVLFYLMMYNKKKILALIVEGRKKNVKRRPNSAAYNKLDCNLEEAMASGPSTSTCNTLLY